MRGFVESLAEHEARGWAYDDTAPGSHLGITAHLDGVQVAAAVADVRRDDLLQAGIGAGDHGFTLDFHPPLPPAALLRLQMRAGAVTLQTLHNSGQSRADDASDPAMPLADTQARPVFILGPARSGTSALALALLKSGHYEGHGEGHLLPLAKRLLTTVDAYYDAYQAGHEVRGSSDTRMRATHGAAFQRMVRRGFVQLTRATYPSGRWIDKTPTAEMVRAAPLMQEMWPHARFIFLKRRVIENILSRRRKFPGDTLENHYLDWVDVLSAWLQVRGSLGAAAMEVDQLDLAQQDEAQHGAGAAAAIAGFLELPDAAAARFRAALATDRPEQTGKLGAVGTLDGLGLPPDGRRGLVAACGRVMSEYGYSYGADYRRGSRAFVDGRGVLVARDGMEPLLVRTGGAPASLGPGWSPRFAITAFAPFVFLELQHIGGQQATWILDQAGQRLGGAVADLPAAAQQALLHRVRPALHASLLDVLQAPDPADEAGDISLLSVDFRLDLFRLCGGLPAPRTVGAGACGDIAMPTPGGLVLTQAAVQACLAVDLQGRYLDACRTGTMTWPSPVDGAVLHEVRGMVLSPLLQAWRCVDRRHGLVFFVLAGNFQQETSGVWFPAAGLLVLQPDRALFRYTVDGAALPSLLAEHVLIHGAALRGFLDRPVAGFAQYTWPSASAHIGHYLWNELSGLEFMVAHLVPERLPRVFDLGGAGGSAFYGPLRRLFPELSGRVVQDHAALSPMLGAAYADGVQVLRFSGSFVSAGLRRRIAALAAETPAARAGSLDAAGGPVVVFGLRVENRTLVDLAAFYIGLARGLCERLGAITVIIDGHNSRGPAGTFSSHLEHRAARRPVEVEHEMAASIQAGLQNLPVRVVSCVGLPMLDNLAWLLRADACVAPWGAGLAKYRWACNLPAYVLVSNFNRKHKNDIHIYGDPAFMEAPTEVLFADAAGITDRPDAEVLLPMDPFHAAFFTNYDAAVEPAADAVAALLRRARVRQVRGSTAP